MTGRYPGGGYKMRTISELTGFSPALLRAWERRYDLLDPDRSPGGHRLYTEDDLRVLRVVRDRLNQGRSIGEVASLGRSVLLDHAQDVQVAVETVADDAPPEGISGEAASAALRANDPETADALTRQGLILGALSVAGPRLEEVARAQASADMSGLSDVELSDALEARWEVVETWRALYDEDLPVTAGLRRLAAFHNETLRPLDPYAFVELLDHRPLALRRLDLLEELAREATATDLERTLDQQRASLRPSHDDLERAARDARASRFVQLWERLRELEVDLNAERIPTYLRVIQHLAAQPSSEPPTSSSQAAEARLLDAVHHARRPEARKLINLGRLSWRLLDDHFHLIGVLEHQLLHALALAEGRLRHAGRVRGAPPHPRDTAELLTLLRDPSHPPLELLDPQHEVQRDFRDDHVAPRQLVGQPAAPGVADATVRRLREGDRLDPFAQGEVLVCSSLRSSAGVLLPLASAVVEEQGGMLIHGVVLARARGLPAVNSLGEANHLLETGDRVAVDGHLGVVTLQR